MGAPCCSRGALIWSDHRRHIESGIVLLRDSAAQQ
jgi:hypothetical protein